MKKISAVLFGLIVLSLNLFSQTQSNILDSIQFRIDQKMGECFATSSIVPLNSISEQLANIKPQNNIAQYWKGYILYYKGIYYMKTKNKDSAKKSFAAGIELLDKMSNKNSEDFALLAMIRSLSIQYSKGMEAAFLFGKVNRNIDKAIELDSLNLRAWYAKGSNDFYTPKQFGGGKFVEESLLKAISLKDQVIPNKYTPSWGRELSYELLIRFYLQNNEKDKAKKIFSEAIEVFPHSYSLKGYENRL